MEKLQWKSPKELVDIVVGQARKRRAFGVVAKIPSHSQPGLTRCQFHLFKLCVFLKTESYLPGTQGREACILGAGLGRSPPGGDSKCPHC